MSSPKTAKERKYLNMKKLSITILILAFMVSCSNQNKDNNAKDTRYQSATYTKPQNPQGATVALNSTDFRVDNDFIYYKGAIFTGKITFDLPQKSGYFFVSNGKLQGETEINYKLTGTKKVQVYEQGKLMQLTQTENNVTTVVDYSDDPASIDNRKIVKVATKYDKNSYSMDFVTLDGEIKKDGKTLKDLEVKEEDYQKYVNDKRHPFINKAISDKSAPGSIFKMVTAIAALESNQISLTEKIDDTYRYTFYRDYQPTCWKPGGHGWLNLTQAIEVSCNFFFYEIGRRAGIAKIDEVGKKLGLGSKTGIELPDEIAGTLSGPDVDKQWTGGKTIQTAIGQSYNDYTPLQMAKYTSMIANGGKNIDVTIVKSINNPDGTTVSRNELDSYIHDKLGVEANSGADLSISQTDLEAIKNGMKNVTSDESGTAYKYFKDFSIPIGGKTGSASIGNSGHANAWFVGFGPFDNPKIAVAVYVKRGEHGAYTAPIARDIFAQYFGMNAVEIKEDMSVNSQMMSIR